MQYRMIHAYTTAHSPKRAKWCCQEETFMECMQTRLLLHAPSLLVQIVLYCRQSVVCSDSVTCQQPKIMQSACSDTGANHRQQASSRHAQQCSPQLGGR
jgi:hypothetical protein